MKPVIIAIVGPSGSGKTYAAEFLNKSANTPVIISYTTRPMRDGEIEGVEHIFVDGSEIPPKDEILADTYFGGYYYYSSVHQVPESGKCICIIDEKGLLALTEKFSDRIDIYSVYIKRKENKLRDFIDNDRISRDKDRIILNESYYNQIIDNNGTLKEFEDKLTLMINNI
jgi:guanylate kinase